MARQKQHAAIFKAYDVRGRTDNGELTPDVMEAIGTAFAGRIEAAGIAVGRDCRPTSAELQDAFITGVLSAGKDVLDVGQATTDTVYFASAVKRIAAAVITASHNPPHYNGVKLCHSAAHHLSGGELTSIRDALPSAKTLMTGETGDYLRADALADYTDHLLDVFPESDRSAGLRVGVDCGNGTAGPLVRAVTDRLPIETVGLYMEPDGRFPNHPANPSSEENLRDLAALVCRENLDLGVAFDTDGDRAVFVDDAGRPVGGSSAVGLLAGWCLARRPGEAIVYDAIASQAVRQTIEARGGRAILSRVGFPFIKEAMRQHDAFFGGETSGHYYFRENYSFDSGTLAMLAMLRVVASADQPLSDLRRALEIYVASGEIVFQVADRDAVIERVAADFANEAETDDLDGLTILWPDKWLNLRASNTEPIIRLNVEGRDSETVDGLANRVRRIINGV